MKEVKSYWDMCKSYKWYIYSISICIGWGEVCLVNIIRLSGGSYFEIGLEIEGIIV